MKKEKNDRQVQNYNYIVFSDEHVNPAYNIKMCLKPLKE